MSGHLDPQKNKYLSSVHTNNWKMIIVSARIQPKNRGILLEPALFRVTVMFRLLWSSWWIGSLHAREAGANVFSLSSVEARMSWNPPHTSHFRTRLAEPPVSFVGSYGA